MNMTVLYQVTVGSLWIMLLVAGVAVGHTYVLQRKLRLQAAEMATLRRTLRKRHQELEQWTTALEQQAAGIDRLGAEAERLGAEMKSWHQDLVSRETALRGPERGA